MSIADLIYSAIEETFEGLAFLELTPEDAAASAGINPAEASWCWSSVTVNAPIAGEVRLMLPLSLLVEIASSLYGVEVSKVKDDNIHDITGEMANTLAGKLMAALYPGESFMLGMPKTGKGTPPAPGLSRYGFLTDDDRTLAVLTNLK